MPIDIKKYKERFDRFEEASIIQNLMNIEKDRIQALMDFGFVFNYEHRYFEATLDINGITHTITIYKSILEKEKIVLYHVHFSYIDTKTYKCLKGANNDFCLYYDLTETYTKINQYAIFNHIYTVYSLNQKEEKETFKQFVESEKSEKETVDTIS